MNHSQKLFRLAGLLAKIAIKNPSRLRHVLGATLSLCDEVADPGLDRYRLPVVRPEDLLDDQEVIFSQLALFPRTNASISLLETMCLLLLLKKSKPLNVFEFGTYKGVSVTQFALNLPPEARIYTLDLPDDAATAVAGTLDPEDASIAREGVKGSLVPPALKERITFLRQDSARFDASPFLNRMDFVFVDGAHNLPFVQNDSEKGWRMLRPGGIIAWHDCRIQDPAVIQYLLGCSFRPQLISGTTLAFAVKP